GATWRRGRTTGRCGCGTWRQKNCRALLCHLPEGESASADLDRGRFIAASPDAWRYLGYGGLIDGEWRTYPAEVFGPIPDMATASGQREAQRGAIP
ncbi:hypothetical protein, partial [Candidatus Competibacter phosphatis]|uniref:hypothetical protein n=1 Tax=Candidatus Competibacter phosphatis TaxID=221280 RepID=UPI00145DC673